MSDKLHSFTFCSDIKSPESGNISKYRRFFWTVFFTVGLYHSINVISNNAKKYFDYPVNIRRVTPPGEQTPVVLVIYLNFSPVYFSRYHSLPKFDAFKIKNIKQISVSNGSASILLWSSESS